MRFCLHKRLGLTGLLCVLQHLEVEGSGLRDLLDLLNKFLQRRCISSLSASNNSLRRGLEGVVSGSYNWHVWVDKLSSRLVCCFRGPGGTSRFAYLLFAASLWWLSIEWVTYDFYRGPCHGLQVTLVA